jgi:hypothetical protein
MPLLSIAVAENVRKRNFFLGKKRRSNGIEISAEWGKKEEEEKAIRKKSTAQLYNN